MYLITIKLYLNSKKDLLLVKQLLDNHNVEPEKTKYDKERKELVLTLKLNL